MSDAQPKFCRDCKWCEPSSVPRKEWLHSRCCHEAARKPHHDYLVSGDMKDIEPNFYCSSMRAGACAQGIYWEPKE